MLVVACLWLLVVACVWLLVVSFFVCCLFVGCLVGCLFVVVACWFLFVACCACCYCRLLVFACWFLFVGCCCLLSFVVCCYCRLLFVVLVVIVVCWFLEHVALKAEKLVQVAVSAVCWAFREESFATAFGILFVQL